MRKVIKEAEFCKECGSVKNYEVIERFCDFCDEQIVTNDESKLGILDITIFSKIQKDDDEDRTYDLSFCSWKCLISKIKTLKCDDFITLPFLYYGKQEDGVMAKDFFDLLK